MGVATRISWLSSFLGLGRVPGQPVEARAFLQRRVAAFTSLAFGMWLFMLVIPFTLGFLLEGGDEALRSFRTPSSYWVHVATTAALGALVLFSRRGERSIDVRYATDALATKLQAIAIGVMLTTAPVQHRPEISFLLGMTHVVVSRAALIPSTPTRTAVLSTAALVPLLLGTYHSIRDRPRSRCRRPSSC